MTWTAGGREVTREDYLALTRALEFGDDTPPDNPAAHPSDLIDPLTEAMAAARDHWDCPVWCDDDDQWEQPRSCENCHGSGCLPNAAMAYLECDHCAGDGRAHVPYTPTGTWRHRPYDHRPSVIEQQQARGATDPHPLTMAGRHTVPSEPS